MGRRKLRTEALRGELYSVATELLTTGGAPAVTTRAVAAGAGTSIAAVNELFGGKAGLVRAIFTEGFARLAEALSAVQKSDDPEADVIELARAFRLFAHRHPHLYAVMFSQPFAEFRPDEQDTRAADATYAIVVGRVAGVLDRGRRKGSAKDAAIGLFAVVTGLVNLERSGLLGSDPRSIDRRFHATVAATLHGFAEGAAPEYSPEA